MKNDYFKVFLAIWVLFPTFLGRLRGDLAKNAQNKIMRHLNLRT